ncbi:hypothetical protein AB6A40_005099 [Gnathostoma spinigerum]|uniref:Dolichyl-diphosphooligosaccharide--protein glycosyltransferase subunit KCP2 n=1 Tax=Gnathostoma spinigerum TaxID=75299 RepID=A0ABD6EQ49_9BILA
MSNYSGSAIISLLFAVLLIGGGQMMKPHLSTSRTGSLIAGILGSLIFVFLLSAISNFEMSSISPSVKAGLVEVSAALIVAMIVSSTIHRVAVTVCLLFSMIWLFYIMSISESVYGTPVAHHVAPIKKRK